MSTQETKEPDKMPGSNLVPANSVAPNTVRIYYALNDSMMKAFRKPDHAGKKEAEDMARVLLGYADLPLLIRAHACMVLGCGIDSDFLYWAKEGVRIAELGCSKAAKIGPVEERLLDNCKHVLKEAQEAYDEAGGDEGARQRAEEEMSDEVDEDEEEVSDEEEEVPAEEMAGEAETGKEGVVVGDDGDVEMVDDGGPRPARPPQKKGTKVRRIHSGDPDGPWERYIEETNSWVDCAAPTQEQLDAAEPLAQTEEYDEMLLGYEGDEFDLPAVAEGMEGE